MLPVETCVFENVECCEKGSVFQKKEVVHKGIAVIGEETVPLFRRHSVMHSARKNCGIMERHVL